MEFWPRHLSSLKKISKVKKYICTYKKYEVLLWRFKVVVIVWKLDLQLPCNQCLSPLLLWVRIPLRRCILDTTSCDKVCQWLAAGRWFSPGIPVSSTNKTDRHDIAEILLKVAVNTITPLNLFDLRRVSDVDRAVFQYVGMLGTPVFLNLKYLERSTAYLEWST